MGTIITAAVLLGVYLRARAYHRKEWRPETKIYPASGISVKESRELGEVGHDFQLAAGTSSRAVYRAIPRNVSAVGKCTKPKNKLVCHRLVSNNRHLRSPEVQTQHVWSKTSSLLRAPLEVWSPCNCKTASLYPGCSCRPVTPRSDHPILSGPRSFLD